MAWNLPPRALLDGAMGTELIARGLAPRVEPAEAWNETRAGDVIAVHRGYVDAGAQVILSNTFGGTRLRLSTFGRQTDVRALNVAGAVLAREARPAGVLVAGSMGPTGALPPPEGNADLIELEDCYAEQAMALAEGGVDFLWIETLYHPKEARAALRGAREGAPGLAVVASMTCRLRAGGYSTTLGFAPEVMLNAFLEEGASGVGANCTLPPAVMLDLVRLLRARTELPILAKPTLGPSGEAALPPEELGVGALALLAAGATAVGGCCGTGPDAIRAARRAIDEAASVMDDVDLG